ncbi:MAG: hypothetical protein AB7W16_03315 [Candidatus Obscuribacterales bacterium]
MKQTFIVAVIATISASMLAAQAQPVSFPGSRYEVSSPGGRYRIENIDRPYAKGNLPSNKYADLESTDQHHLVLSDGTKRTPFHSYSRCVDILWSPDGKSFVMNDWVGSNICEAYLFQPGDIHHPEDIGSKLVDSPAAQKIEHKLRSAGHLYISAKKWLRPGLLEIMVRGHNGKPFSCTFLRKASGEFELLKNEKAR